MFAAVQPRACPLAGGAHSERREVVVGASDDLDTGGDAVRGETGRHVQHRAAAEYVEPGGQYPFQVVVDRPAANLESVPDVFVTGLEASRAARWADESVIPLEHLAKLRVEVAHNLQLLGLRAARGFRSGPPWKIKRISRHQLWVLGGPRGHVGPKAEMEMDGDRPHDLRLRKVQVDLVDDRPL